MTILKSIKSWVAYKQQLFPSLADVSIVIMGDDGDLSPPFFGLMESGSALVEQGELISSDVSAYEITAELHTIPVSEDEDGTDAEDERRMRFDLHEIITDEAAKEWINGRNNWTVFDIRSPAPTTEAQDGRRVSRIMITVIAAPI